MLKEKIIEKLGEKIVEKSKEILLEEGEERVKVKISEKKNEHYLEIYKRNLDETLLKLYGNEKFYDDLCRMLLANDNMDVFLERCYDRDVLDDESDEMFIERITQEIQGKPYNEVMVKDALKYIGECAFKSFNQIKDPEHNVLKNIIKREEDKTRIVIRQSQEETIKMLENHRMILNSINQSDIQKSNIGYADDITWGCKNPVKHFLGREKDISSIERILEKDDNKNEKTALWIYGMGGIGKTQLCRKLYFKLKTQYEYIGWISYQGNLKYSLVNSVNKLEQTGDLEQEYKSVIRYINSLGKKLILFIDNYDVINDCIDDIEAMQCHVIVTSRKKILIHLLDIN